MNNFKVHPKDRALARGDWVKIEFNHEVARANSEEGNKDSMTIQRIIEVEDFGDFKRFYFKKDDWFDDNVLDGCGTTVTLWQPEKEEVCIFWNYINGIKVISRFYAFEHDGFTEAIEFRNYKFCSPYLSVN